MEAQETKKSLPIEIWEAILDEIHWLPGFAGSPIPTRVFHLQQRTLGACARVCRAWSPHACFLLWHDVLLDTPPSVAAFVESVRDAPDRWTPLVTSLFLHSDVGDYTTDLFMQSFPNLRVLSANAVNWNYVHPQLFRMRLPFFASLSELQLDKCIFPSLRIMLDLVWASSNLVHLVLQDCRVSKENTSVAVSHNLERACRSVHGCRKLTSLYLYVRCYTDYISKCTRLIEYTGISLCGRYPHAWKRVRHSGDHIGHHICILHRCSYVFLYSSKKLTS